MVYPRPPLVNWGSPDYAGDMTKSKRQRTDAQVAAEEAYAASREIIQVNIKMKAKADVKMWKKLRKRFPDLTDPAIARAAIKKLADEEN